MAQAGTDSAALQQFRAEWRADIQQNQKRKQRGSHAGPGGSSTSSGAAGESRLSEKEQHALALYTDAVYHEGEGSLNEALALYRKAFALDRHVDRLYWHQFQTHGEVRSHRHDAEEPENAKEMDVEAIANLGWSGHHHHHPQPEQQSGPAADGPSTSAAAAASADANDEAVATAADTDADGDGMDELAVSLADMSLAIIERDPHIVPEGRTHISALPSEVVDKIIQYIVFPTLDLATLERMGATCKALYLHARDPSIWQAACRRVWGARCKPDAYGGSYRRMWLERPRLRFDGVYVSKESYIRSGEKELSGYYAPFHVVEHYRYFRFFSDGTLLCATTPDDPKNFIQQLRHTNAHHDHVWFGQFDLDGSDGVEVRVTRVTHAAAPAAQPHGRRRAREKPRGPDPYSQQLLTMSLAIGSVQGRRNNRLFWREYALSVNDPEGNMITSEINTRDLKPFHFVRVRNFQ